MNRKDKARKLEQRRAHQERRDHRWPEHPFTADERRNSARDERREARKAARR